MKQHLYNFLKKQGYTFENIAKRDKADQQFLSSIYNGENSRLLVRSIHFIKNLLHTYPELSIRDEQQGYLFSFFGLDIYVESYEEIFILTEVFFKKDYNFSLSPNAVLLDIGANIGCTSLYFSKDQNVSKIYAFEPVKATYEQAMANFNRNEVASKVVFQNVGLGKEEREETFLFNPGVKGNTGVRGAQSTSFDKEKVIPVSVIIKNATHQLKNILEAHPNQEIVIKMDCEGGEYEIIENLSASGMLAKVHALAIEWHDNGATSLLQYLKLHHFKSFHPHLARNSGMIYAINTAL